MSMQVPRVLLVDDEAEVRDVLRDEFEYSGFSVIEACGGDEAFDLVRYELPDIIVSDIRMPEGSGMILLERIKSSKYSYIPFIVVSAFSDTTAAIAREHGAYAYIPKPFELPLLIHKAREAITKN